LNRKRSDSNDGYLLAMEDMALMK